MEQTKQTQDLNKSPIFRQARHRIAALSRSRTHTITSLAKVLGNYSLRRSDNKERVWVPIASVKLLRGNRDMLIYLSKFCSSQDWLSFMFAHKTPWLDDRINHRFLAELLISILKKGGYFSCIGLHSLKSPENKSLYETLIKYSLEKFISLISLRPVTTWVAAICAIDKIFQEKEGTGEPCRTFFLAVSDIVRENPSLHSVLATKPFRDLLIKWGQSSMDLDSCYLVSDILSTLTTDALCSTQQVFATKSFKKMIISMDTTLNSLEDSHEKLEILTRLNRTLSNITYYAEIDTLNTFADHGIWRMLDKMIDKTVKLSEDSAFSVPNRRLQHSILSVMRNFIINSSDRRIPIVDELGKNFIWKKLNKFAVNDDEVRTFFVGTILDMRIGRPESRDTWSKMSLSYQAPEFIEAYVRLCKRCFVNTSSEPNHQEYRQAITRVVVAIRHSENTDTTQETDAAPDQAHLLLTREEEIVLTARLLGRLPGRARFNYWINALSSLADMAESTKAQLAITQTLLYHVPDWNNDNSEWHKDNFIEILMTLGKKANNARVMTEICKIIEANTYHKYEVTPYYGYPELSTIELMESTQREYSRWEERSFRSGRFMNGLMDMYTRTQSKHAKDGIASCVYKILEWRKDEIDDLKKMSKKGRLSPLQFESYYQIHDHESIQKIFLEVGNKQSELECPYRKKQFISTLAHTLQLISDNTLHISVELLQTVLDMIPKNKQKLSESHDLHYAITRCLSEFSRTGHSGINDLNKPALFTLFQMATAAKGYQISRDYSEKSTLQTDIVIPITTIFEQLLSSSIENIAGDLATPENIDMLTNVLKYSTSLDRIFTIMDSLVKLNKANPKAFDKKEPEIINILFSIRFRSDDEGCKSEILERILALATDNDSFKNRLLSPENLKELLNFVRTFVRGGYHNYDYYSYTQSMFPIFAQIITCCCQNNQRHSHDLTVESRSHSSTQLFLPDTFLDLLENTWEASQLPLLYKALRSACEYNVYSKVRASHYLSEDSMCSLIDRGNRVKNNNGYPQSGIDFSKLSDIAVTLIHSIPSLDHYEMNDLTLKHIVEFLEGLIKIQNAPQQFHGDITKALSSFSNSATPNQHIQEGIQSIMQVLENSTIAIHDNNLVSQNVGA